MITLARLSGWNIAYEVTTNISLGIGIFLTIIWQFKKTVNSINIHKDLWIIPIISLITFSLAQSENWIWGWQMQILLSVLTVTIGLVLLSNYLTNWLCFILAILMVIVGTYSFVNGLLYWPIGLLVLLIAPQQDRKNKIFKIAVWTAASLIIIGTYMYDYHQPLPEHPSPPPVASVAYLTEYTKYVLIYLGAPLCRYQTDLAIVFGILGLFIPAYSIWNLRKFLHGNFSVLLPYIALSLYSIGSAIVTGFGRSGMGYAQATSHRYITISNFLWICNVILLYLLMNIKTENYRTRPVILKRYAISLVITIIVTLAILNSADTTRYYRYYHQWLTPAQSKLLWPNWTTNDQLLTRLYPDIATVKTGRNVLKKYKLSVFRDEENHQTPKTKNHKP